MSPRQYPEQLFAQSQAVEQLAQDISLSSPFEAITGVTPLIDSLAEASDTSIAERARAIFALDEAAQMHARSYIERFLALRGAADSERRSLWALARGYWATVFDAYGDMLTTLEGDEGGEGELIAQVCVRAIRAGVLRAKWDAFGGAGMGQDVWSRLNAAYRLALRCKLDRVPVRPRTDRTTETSAEREYLRAMALHSLSLEQLDPIRVEATTSLVHYVLQLLVLTNTPTSTASYWVDVAAPAAPARLVTTPGNVALPRYFCGASASMSLHGLLDLASRGQMPPGLPLQMDGGCGMASSVLARMVRVWSNAMPVRRQRRHAMDGEMLVVEGIQRFLGRMLGDEEPSKVWLMHDASLQGMGAIAARADLDGLRVGTLLGIHPTDGDRWRVGVVRRIKKPSWVDRPPFAETGEVGIEMLGTAPQVVAADDGARSLAVLLLDPLQKGLPVRVIVPLPAPTGEQPLYLVGHNKTLKLVLLDTLEYGTDFEVRSYLCAP